MWLVGGLVGIYMWHGWYLEFRGPSVGMQDKADALTRLCALPLSDMILAQLDDSAVMMMMTVSTLEQYIACFWR